MSNNADKINNRILKALKRIPAGVNRLAAMVSSVDPSTLSDRHLHTEVNVLLQEIEAAVGHLRTTLRALDVRADAHNENNRGRGGPTLADILREATEPCDNPNCPIHGSGVRARAAAAGNGPKN
jgi:hypothetical protein